MKRCAIDMLAGPSEVLVIADSTANVETVAADLLAQVTSFMFLATDTTPPPPP